MKPYYDEDGIQIYLGDCQEILPSLSVGLLLTDPPYGINYDTSHQKYKNGIERPVIVGDNVPFNGAHLAVFSKAIIWGANCFAASLPSSPKWLAWIKTARDEADIRQADMELAWTNCVTRPRVFHHLWIGAYKASESGLSSEHPTQKPLALMKWCLSLVEWDGPVVDPYCGSGTTLRAAKDSGHPAIGVEIEERYCEIAANRLRQRVLPLELA